MPDQTTILVPIRYPLTDESAHTLAAAGRLGCEYAPANLIVLHVNLCQTSDRTQTRELTEAISSTINGIEASVITRSAFLVEEAILDEATQNGADIVVIGANQKPRWRRLIGRLLGNDPAIGSYLRKHTTDVTEIMEIDTVTETASAESA
jgi:K+-sensing histidine kinase KdpD